MFHASIMRALMAFFAMFPLVFKTFEKRYRRFCLTEALKTVLIPKFVID